MQNKEKEKFMSKKISCKAMVDSYLRKREFSDKKILVKITLVLVLNSLLAVVNRNC